MFHFEESKKVLICLFFLMAITTGENFTNNTHTHAIFDIFSIIGYEPYDDEHHLHTRSKAKPSPLPPKFTQPSPLPPKFTPSPPPVTAPSPTTPVPYNRCDLCYNGNYPGTTSMVINMLGIGVGSCKQYYAYGLQGNIPNHLCSALQYFAFEPCGCNIVKPAPTPAPTLPCTYMCPFWKLCKLGATQYCDKELLNMGFQIPRECPPYDSICT